MLRSGAASALDESTSSSAISHSRCVFGYPSASQEPPLATYSDGQTPLYRSVAFRTWQVGDSSRQQRFSRRGAATAEESQPNAATEQSPAFKKPHSFSANTKTSAASSRIVHHSSPTPKRPNPVKRTASTRSASLQDLASSPTSSRVHLSGAPQIMVHDPVDSVLVAHRYGLLLEGGKSGDCYSSREYMHHATVGRENGVPSMERLNLSFDGLNLCSPGVQRACGSRMEDDFSMRSCPPQRHTSTGFLPVLKFPTTTATQPRAHGTSLRCPSNRQQRLRCDMGRRGQAVGDARPTFIIDSTLRARTRSLENTSILGVRSPPLRHEGFNVNRPCSSSACGSMMTAVKDRGASVEKSTALNATNAVGGGGAIQSAKNLFRRLYASSSTLRGIRSGGGGGGRRGAKKKDSATAGSFQFATSPFFEIRLPQPEERMFLPYNIQYQLVDGEENSRLKVPVASPPARQFPHAGHFNDPSSPDEGISVSNSSDSSFIANITPTATLNTNLLLERSVDGTPTSRSSTSENHATIVQHRTAMAFGDCDAICAKSGLNGSSTRGHSLKCLHSLPSSRTDIASLQVSGRETAPSFSNWDELLQFLRGEITQIRAKDTQILTNLKKLEVELGSMHRKS